VNRVDFRNISHREAVKVRIAIGLGTLQWQQFSYAGSVERTPRLCRYTYIPLFKIHFVHTKESNNPDWKQRINPQELVGFIF
jgi:hypothetical protein